MFLPLRASFLSVCLENVHSALTGELRCLQLFDELAWLCGSVSSKQAGTAIIQVTSLASSPGKCTKVHSFRLLLGRLQIARSVCNWLGHSGQALQAQPLPSAKPMVTLTSLQTRDAVCWASSFFLLSRRSKSLIFIDFGIQGKPLLILNSCLLIKTNKQAKKLTISDFQDCCKVPQTALLGTWAETEPTETSPFS